MITKSFYTDRMEDSYAAYLSKEEFDVYGDGVHDDTKGIQRAINMVKNKYGFGIVFIPEGSYIITDTIYVPRAIRLIGYGKTRPKLRLEDHTSGYEKLYPKDKGKGKYMVWFTHKVPEVGETEMEFDANPGTFYSALSNIDFEIGKGNPSAIALRTHYAQHGFISHCIINVGSGMAGIFDVGNEMEDVHIFGGQYGIITTKCSPGWPFVMVDTSFTGQSVAAIKTREAGLTIIRTTVKDTPIFVSVDEGCMEKLYVEDSTLINVSDAAIVVACEKNTLAQYNMRNVICIGTTIFAKYRESGRIIEGNIMPYLVKSYVHGLQIDELNATEDMKTTFDVVSITKEEIIPFKANIPTLPSMDTWVNLKDLGAKGDGKTDDTAVIKKAIQQYETIYLPQGWYVVTDTIVLKADTKLIGMSPVGTQLILPDNTEKFSLIGAPKALLETSVGGSNIVCGIAIDTGGRNARAVGCKWMSGETSYMNDVKFMGGHGIMEWGNGGFINPYNFNGTGDLYPERKWDSQYWSLWITNGGGGVFKDIWSASPYASAGLYISDTSTKGCIYAMSLEHHVRAEAKFKNVSNWKIFGLQTEEELAEGPKAQPVELIECNNILFANLYMFRVVMVNTPFDYCIRSTDCKEIEFLNLHNYSQMKYTINNMLLDINTNTEVRPWQIARLYITGNAPVKALGLDDEIYKNPAQKICGGFQFVHGGCSDYEGNFYFVDGELNRIYQINGRTLVARMIMDAPFKPHALACDTEGRVMVVAEYNTPKGATEKGNVINHERPEDATGSSYCSYYPVNIKLCAYTFDPNNPEETLTVLQKVKRSDVKRPKKVLYPGNRWRDYKDYETAVMNVQEECFMGLDGATIIPVQYDLMRAASLSEAIPGKPFYSVDEYYKRTYEFITDEDGYIKKLSLVVEQGEFCSISDKEGRIYVCDGQIKIYNKKGLKIGQIKVPERPSTIAFGGEDGNTLYVTGRESVYVIKL
jgi:polygalacturonase